MYTIFWVICTASMNFCPYESENHYRYVKVKVLLMLLWIATSTWSRFSCGSSFYLPQLIPALPGTHYSCIGWSNVGEVSCSRIHNYWNCLTFPNYTAGLTGAMWVKFLLKETWTTTNSIIWESNQDLLDHRPIPNHCMLLSLYSLTNSTQLNKWLASNFT